MSGKNCVLASQEAKEGARVSLLRTSWSGSRSRRDQVMVVERQWRIT
jgi:hypothetical protein